MITTEKMLSIIVNIIINECLRKSLIIIIHVCIILLYSYISTKTLHIGDPYIDIMRGGGWRGVTFVHQAQTDNSKFALASYKYLNYKL